MPLDANGKWTVLDFDTALGDVYADAATAGIVIQTGSVEAIIANWLALRLVAEDTGNFNSYQRYFNPTGSDIDLQNPGTPRLAAAVSNGYLKLTNSTGSPINVTIQSIFTAPNGNTYTTGTNAVTVTGTGGINYIQVSSVSSGIAQNLPASQAFTGSYSLTVTNPQPFTDGRDIETDTQYIDRVIYLRTNNTSQQATPAAIRELLQYYSAAQFYVNNTSNDLPYPITVPANGYLSVVNFPSSTQATAAEIQHALNILAARFEFGNTNSTSTTLHPILGGTIYTGPFPENFYVAPAQAVVTTITASITVRFDNNVDSSEKLLLVKAFVGFFAQNVIDYFGGAAGNVNITWQELKSPLPAPVGTSTAVLAAAGDIGVIAPAFSIEQVRALISDESQLAQIPTLHYQACSILTVALDPSQAGQSVYTLSILAPAGGTVATIDFKSSALFTDLTAWYDRYIYIDPTKITVTVTEV